jgi:hypothetical protein
VAKANEPVISGNDADTAEVTVERPQGQRRPQQPDPGDVAAPESVTLEAPKYGRTGPRITEAHDEWLRRIRFDHRVSAAAVIRALIDEAQGDQVLADRVIQTAQAEEAETRRAKGHRQR